MGHQTQSYNRSFRGSVGAGIGSFFGGSGRSYYILEHKVSSRYHRAGESQEIIVDQIELGRDPRCQVRFDESFTTVSRRHAAIAREGDRWKLISLSKTNPTFLNGREVHKEWYLQNGDEIRLSANGPKIGFIIPTGNKASVGSIGLSRRLSLFRHQALRPYKQGLTILSILLVLVVAGAVYWGYSTQDEMKKKSEEIIALMYANKNNAWKVDSLNNELALLDIKQDEYEKMIADVSKEVNNVRILARNNENSSRVTPQGGNASSSVKSETSEAKTNSTDGSATVVNAALTEISHCSQFVYAIFLEKWVITNLNGIEEEGVPNRRDPVVGTGFLLKDGKFVTARHVIETWMYYQYLSDKSEKDYMTELNILAHNGGKVVMHYKAISGSGRTLTFTNEQFLCNRGGDKITETISRNGRTFDLRTSTIIRHDWACYNTGLNIGLDYNFSPDLPAGTELDVLGFPHGRGAENLNHIVPINSSCRVSRPGLDVDMTLMVSNDNTESGNSGGPVLYKNNGAYQVIGVVSGNSYEKGRIVPISAITD
ncbi:MAG: FHA domain-containing protein [Tannerellaceae bacterium]|jgi:hypothetical protein|nr:FHA domain-containing protein [Tannerellaceae bacterium]